MESLKLYFEGNGFFKDFFINNVSYNEVSFEECDFVISNNFEIGNANKKQLQKKLNKYIGYSKTVIIFMISDYNNLLKIPSNVILFRTSLYKSIKKDNEEILPYLWESFDEEFQSLDKTELPIIGFCGNVKKNSGHRLSTINAIKKDKKLISNFITLYGFGGGKEELVSQFKKNILESHFTISNRGKGNFAIRFYQVLSLGRIPVLLDTDIILPFENEISWKSLIIMAKSEKDLVKKTKNYWKEKSNEELIENQLNCKDIFEKYFTLKGFGNRIELLLKAEKLNPRKIKNKPLHFLKFPHLKYKAKRYFYFYKLKYLGKI